MSLALTEDQQLLKDSARGFFADKAGVANLRANREARRPYDEALWSEIVAMGFPGALIPEAHGGSEMGFRAMGVVLEAAGRTLAASPLLQTGLVGASAFLIAGEPAERDAYLARIAAGDITVALAVDEAAHHDPVKIALAARRTGSGWSLSGTKRFVADGGTADLLIVAARTAGQPGDAHGLTLFYVDAHAPGVTRRPLAAVDSRGYADIHFDAVAVDGSQILGIVDEGMAPLERLLDVSRIGVAAEMLGAIDSAFEMTMDYLKTRTQFGQLIGSFQALQHRAAKMLVEIELTRSCIVAALDALDNGANDIREWASLAKARAADTLHLVSNETVQMHGGIGMTDQHDAGLYLKRARVQEALYGSAGFHRDRYARLMGL